WCPAIDGPELDDWWAHRPRETQHIRMFGRQTELPRRQRAYGRDYRFSGQTSTADPVPDWLAPVLGWARDLDARIDGLLVNWYDGAHGENIGPHRDAMPGLVPGTPIVTVSFGAPRTFRLRAHGTKGAPVVDLDARHGHVIVIPWQTNERYTHAVPHFARDTGRRISVTLRAFSADSPHS
ncbi:MAG: alpha-ketoglutarate-dependent dioxygenase AlkB, partial [Myxococcota bacterium]